MSYIKKKFNVINLNSDNSKICGSEFEAVDYIINQSSGRYMIFPVYEVVKEIEYDCTIILTVFQCPQRTIRAIESVINQVYGGSYELLIIGDNCPNLSNLIGSGYFTNIVLMQALKGNRVEVINLSEWKGGHGYNCRNKGIELSKGKYIMFLDNDDYLLPNHISERMKEIEKGTIDIIAFDTFRGDINYKRDVVFLNGYCGHAEILVKREILKSVPAQTPEYGHDWVMIENILKCGAKSKIVHGKTTYNIMSFPHKKEFGID